jgi:hypothetical protein
VARHDLDVLHLSLALLGAISALHFATEAERAAMKEIRWWTIAELVRSSETVFPTNLAKVLRRLV